MIGIDTFSWKKLIELKNNEWNELILELLSRGDFFITHEGKKEFEHFFPDDIKLLEKILIVPVIKSSLFFDWKLKNFDDNDASLLEYAELKRYPIITEDIPMLVEGTDRNRIIQLIDYFGILFRQELITKRELFEFISQFRKWKNISKRKEKKLKDISNL